MAPHGPELSVMSPPQHGCDRSHALGRRPQPGGRAPARAMAVLPSAGAHIPDAALSMGLWQSRTWSRTHLPSQFSAGRKPSLSVRAGSMVKCASRIIMHGPCAAASSTCSFHCTQLQTAVTATTTTTTTTTASTVPLHHCTTVQHPPPHLFISLALFLNMIPLAD